MTRTIDEIDKFVRRTRAERAAEQELDFVAICLVGFSEPIPRYVGDNELVWPVKLAITRDPKNYAKKPDLEQPIHKVSVLRMVWCETDRHAKRLKERLESLMLGQESAGTELRHSWINVDDLDATWTFLLQDALAEIRKREQMDVFDEVERQRRIKAKARRGK